MKGEEYQSVFMKDKISNISHFLEENEEVREVYGFPEYLVSNFGKVFSFRKKTPAAVGNRRPDGYRVVTICSENGQYKLYIHRLVAMAFIPNPGSLPMINHKDCNPSNNKVSNLEWCDSGYNTRYGAALGRYKRSPYNRGRATIGPNEAVDIFKSKETTATLAKKYGLSSREIASIRCGSAWADVTGDLLVQKNKSPAMTGSLNPASKPVICVKTGREYESILIASRATGLNRNTIQKMCTGKTSEYKGLLFNYNTKANG